MESELRIRSYPTSLLPLSPFENYRPILILTEMPQLLCFPELAFRLDGAEPGGSVGVTRRREGVREEALEGPGVELGVALRVVTMP